jgi:hypothetical protein
VSSQLQSKVLRHKAPCCSGAGSPDIRWLGFGITNVPKCANLAQRRAIQEKLPAAHHPLASRCPWGQREQGTGILMLERSTR